MGLDTTHDCWHGAYSSFMVWRKKICKLAGYGDLMQYEGFEELNFNNDPPIITRLWPKTDDALIRLLNHSDCDGDIHTDDCNPIADRLEEILLLMVGDEDHRGGVEHGDNDGWYSTKTKIFIEGLRAAATANENVSFH